ncbi:MAG: hypothetical protein ACLU5I_05425 [Alistipes finegoldii]
MREIDFNKVTGRRIALNAAPTLKYTYGGASLVDGYREVLSIRTARGSVRTAAGRYDRHAGAKPYSAVTVESLVEKGVGFRSSVGSTSRTTAASSPRRR